MFLLMACATTSGTGEGDDTASSKIETSEPEGSDADLILSSYTELANAAPDACGGGDAIVPIPENVGNWAAARLVPPTSPFTVQVVQATFVRYSRVHDECDPTPARRFRLFVSADAAPSTDPEVLAELSVPSGGELEEDRSVVVAVSPEVTVDAGQSLYVAVEMVQGSCLQACEPPEGDGSHSWWSWEDEPPYAWTAAGERGTSSSAYDLRAWGE